MKTGSFTDNIYIARVTARDEDGIGLTMGFTFPRDLYDSLQAEHNFPIKEEGHRFLHISDDEYYRIYKVIQQHSKRNKLITQLNI